MICKAPLSHLYSVNKVVSVQSQHLLKHLLRGISHCQHQLLFPHLPNGHLMALLLILKALGNKPLPAPEKYVPRLHRGPAILTRSRSIVQHCNALGSPSQSFLESQLPAVHYLVHARPEYFRLGYFLGRHSMIACSGEHKHRRLK